MKSDLSRRVAALAFAASEIESAETRLEFCEILLDALSDLSVEATQLCAAVLVAQEDGSTAHALGSALRERVGVYDGRHFGTKPPLDVDLLVVTVKDVELRAVQSAFGVDPSAFLKVEGEQVWLQTVGDARTAIVCVRTAGNVDSAYLLSRMWFALRFPAAVLIGMAAGVEGQVEIGDVVVADGILGYESVTLTTKGPVPAFDYFGISNSVAKRALKPASHPNWALRVQAEVASVTNDITLPRNVAYPDGVLGWSPEAKRGIVLAGSKLVENGKLPSMRKALHQRARALEMEGCGFAMVCREAQLRWLVVRGIADFGNPGRRETWQFAATYAAAALVRDNLSDPEYTFLRDA